MSMAQEGTERNLDLKESTTFAGGGGLVESLSRAETIVFGDSKMLSESFSRAETVIITNV